MLGGRQGFSLIELMVTVAVIGLLAAIAIPRFISYQLRSRAAEARTNLGGIRTAQESFAADADNYANVTTAEGNTSLTTQKVIWQHTDCNAACQTTAPENCTEFSCIGFAPAGAVYYRYMSGHRLAAALAPPEYCMAAEGDLDGDGNNSSFEFQSSNANTGTGLVDCALAACPGGITPDIVTNCRPDAF